MGDLLDIERQEAAFVWKAMAHGLPVFHRNDGSPLAILQCALVTAPRAIDAPRSSPGMSWLRGLTQIVAQSGACFLPDPGV